MINYSPKKKKEHLSIKFNNPFSFQTLATLECCKADLFYQKVIKNTVWQVLTVFVCHWHQ